MARKGTVSKNVLFTINKIGDDYTADDADLHRLPGVGWNFSCETLKSQNILSVCKRNLSTRKHTIDITQQREIPSVTAILVMILHMNRKK